VNETGSPAYVADHPVAPIGAKICTRPGLLSNKPMSSVGAFPRKVTEVKALVRNA
jgi:hypothetical protein